MACPDIGTGAAANVLTSLLKKVSQEVKMIISLPQSFSDMEVEVQRLNNLIRDIKVELARVDMNPKSIVKDWLDKADEAIESSRSIRSDFEQHKDYLSCCPNCLCRYRIGKHIRDWKRNVVQLESERQSNFPPSGEYGDPTPRNQVPIQRSAQMEVVERWLTDEDSNIRRIGIHGMGGVGKTSLLDTINDSQTVRNSFELIIKLTVSKNHIIDLQNCLADRLKLRDFKDNSNFEERKNRLRSHLKNKKYVLLLDDMWADDMWTSDELQKLGVSLNDTGFKIVLTTQDKEVCTRMNVQETITVEPLLEDEGWELFRSRAFENLNGNAPPELEEVAREIAKECKGLPLAIIVVAAAMTHHSAPYEWEVALDQMKNVHETFYDLHAGVDKKLFQRLKWSYDVLPNYLKTCFLYFAAYPEDEVIRVEGVIDMWVAEGLVQGSGETYLHDIGHSYIKHLKDRCLIEEVHNHVGRISSVKIHDVLRDLAIRIAENEHGCYFKAGQGPSHFPVEEVDGKACERMSLMYNGLQSLPTTLACSSLSVLLLGKNPGIKEVPESFLRELSSLKVLDLHDTSIMSLPPCIGNLKHLASLQLSYCQNISELPETICDLKELQFLDVSYWEQLQCLPESITELKCLRALHIGNCRRLSNLPRGISELVSLERLTMWGSSIRLDFEEEANAEERKYGCLKDLQSLRRLRVLHVRIKSRVKEGVMGNWSKMRDLLLYFEGEGANQDYLPQDMQAMKDLESFTLWGCDVERLPNWISEFRKLAYLRLCNCKQLKELPAEFLCLRELWIELCDKLEELGMGFPKLEQLTLTHLESLECVGAVAAASGSGGLGEGASPLLPMLKSLQVIACPKLKRLRGGWDKLKCLEEIVGSREWWDAIQWEDPNMKASLESKFWSLF